jgi:hypothetical protein
MIRTLMIELDHTLSPEGISEKKATSPKHSDGPLASFLPEECLMLDDPSVGMMLLDFPAHLIDCEPFESSLKKKEPLPLFMLPEPSVK